MPAGDRAAADATVTAVARDLGHLQAFGLRPIGDLQTRLVEESDWADAWKAYFPVLRVGERIVIRPTWRRHRRRPGDVVLALDPGMAFGTGLHPTTRLCLAALEAVADRGDLDGARVLDVGCGSGILAIAAVRLGATSAFGVDTDPVAEEATLANARRNRLVRRIRAREGSLPSGEPAFDVVLANLIAGVLVPLATPLRDELRPGRHPPRVRHLPRPRTSGRGGVRGRRAGRHGTDHRWGLGGARGPPAAPRAPVPYDRR